MNELALQCQGLTKWYGETPAIVELDLVVERGKTLVLLGPSGCGKTTFLRLIAGFETPGMGEIIVDGVTVAGKGVFMPPERRKVGMVFQDYALFPHLSVHGNVRFGVNRASPQRKQKMEAVLDLTGLTGLEERMPHELSGGQQQRVALARALASEPKALLLDEPFSNLDSSLRRQMREEVRDILVTSGTTAIFVTHDQEEALVMGDQVAILRAGRLEQMDTPEVIYHSPASKFVATFMGIADFLPSSYAQKIFRSNVGATAWPSQPPPLLNVDMMFRPDDVLLTASEQGAGHIVSRTFQGAYFMYEVILDSGDPLHCRQSYSNQKLPVGARVDVGLHSAYQPSYFSEGRPLSDAVTT